MDETPPHLYVGAPPQAPPSPQAKPRKRGPGLLIAVAALAFVTGGGAGTLLTLVATGQVSAAAPEAQASPSPKESILSVAQRKCAPREPGVKLGDNGRTLTIETFGKENYSGISLTDFSCILTELKVSDAIRSEIQTTRALDGRQSADWNGLRASWTYHPDDGMNMVVTVTS